MTDKDIEKIPFKLRVTMAQAELKVPKTHINKFGGFKYRNAEDILEAVKPVNQKYHLMLTLSDEMRENEHGKYIIASACLTDAHSDESITVYGNADQDEEKSKMDKSQKSGSASTYARKYALNGLYLIDDSIDDPDSKEPPKQNQSNTKQQSKANQQKQYQQAQQNSDPFVDQRKDQALQRIRKIDANHGLPEGKTFKWVFNQLKKEKKIAMSVNAITPENIQYVEEKIAFLENQ